MAGYNIFYKPKNKENMENENQYNLSQIGNIKEDWTGVGENASGGLGIRDMNAYIGRADVKGAMENLSKSKLWQRLTSSYQKDTREFR